MGAPHSSLKDNVYAYIAGRIDSGELSAGDRVSEQAICDAMGVSRTPVREALIQLASDGYLDNLPRRGFRVRGFDRENALEVFEIMGSLDGQAAYLACPGLDDDTIAQMRFLVGSMDLAIESRLMLKYDDLQREFHYTYYHLCGNQRLIELLRQLERCFIKRDYSTVDREEAYRLLRKANDEHRRILELFEARDAAAVRDYIRDVHWNTENAQFTVW
ncbi:GntR family transcriptional regulator [Enorma burkinafasonensis]|uniref:GntR family transcriptional regulator n=1 Tax=Enorma burkinafasonensis TaxID=2590867 RepID=UPI0026ED78CF|nr:GntR family transcriptional regulator [Enorma burkinafasonensis]MCI7730294.1 GntR family transcriptional regulator [Enorma burkinafasonensis]